WAEDPSNDDPRYDRVKVRQTLPMLAEIGITPDRLAATAEAMSAEAQTLAWATRRWSDDHVTAVAGDLVIDRDAVSGLPWALRTRLFASAIRWFSGSGYKPRRAALDTFVSASQYGDGGTLGGVVASREADVIRLSREPAAASTPTAAKDGAIWDHRWRIAGPCAPGLSVGALGAAGIAASPNWREIGLPRSSLLALPAVWNGPALVAAPLVGMAHGWSATLCPTFADFLDTH
ncbi:MAG: hypothetical protein AAF914_12925, partial [Pseudomonadota bacterium]